MPGAACLLWAVLEDRRRWGVIGLAAIALCGLALTHYRVAVLAAILAVVLFAAEVGRGRRAGPAINILAVSLGAAVLFLPWLIHISSSRLAQVGSILLSRPAVPDASSWIERFAASLGGNPWSYYLPLSVWLLLPLAIAWGLRRPRGRNVGIVALWWCLNLLAANPQWLGLPGFGILSSFAVWIAAYIPVGLLVGAGLGWLAQAAGRRGAQRVLSLGVVGLAVWGARQRLGDVLPGEHALVTRPDVRAADWIRRNTPASARFLTNSFLAYDDTTAVGSDAGWWLPILAGRATTLPPINYTLEQGAQPDYRQSVTTLTASLQADGLDDPVVLAELVGRGVTHVYLGQRQGRVNYGGPVLEPAELLDNPRFQLLYHEDRVWIFAMCGGACDG